MMEQVHDELIKRVKPRETVQINLPGGSVLEGPRGTQLETFLKDLNDPLVPILGAVVNGELRELTYRSRWIQMSVWSPWAKPMG